MNLPYSIIYSDLPDLKNKEKCQHGVMKLSLKRGQMCGYIKLYLGALRNILTHTAQL